MPWPELLWCLKISTFASEIFYAAPYMLL